MATEEEESDQSLLALFSPVLTPTMAEFCEKLSRREAMFKKVHVGTACVALLAGKYIIQNVSQRGAEDVAALPSSCKQLTQFMLSTLPHCGDSYLPVFKFISSLCKGEAFLGWSGGRADVTFLLTQLRMSQLEGKEKEEDKKEESAKTETTEEVDGKEEKGEPEGGGGGGGGGGGTQPRTKSETKTDSRSEVQKLFEKLKTGSRHDIGLTHRNSPTPEYQGEPYSGSSHSPGSLASDSFFQMTQAVLKNLGAGRQLLEFCLALPVFKSLAEEKGGFLGVEGATDPTAALASTVKRLQQLRCAVEAVSILLQLPSPLLEPLTTARLDSLLSLLVSCLQAATVATVALGNVTALKAGGKTDTGGPKLPHAEDKEQVCSSLAELFGGLSCSHQQVRQLSPSIASTRYLVCEIASITVERVYSKLSDSLRESPRIRPCVLRSLKTVVVYQILSGLQPLLGAGTTGTGMGNVASGASKGSEGVDPTKQFGHVKLSVPLVELTHRAMQLTQSLLEIDGVEEVPGDSLPSATPLTIKNLDIHTAHSSWQCVELLFTNLPLLRLLFSLLFNSFKKAHTLAKSSEAGSTHHPHSASQRDTSAPIKTRTEKEDRIARMLQLSLSEKISEKLAAAARGGEGEREGEGEGDEGSERTPSPVSTVSSSGEVEGVYTLYTDEGSLSPDASDEDEEEEEEEGPSGLIPAMDHPLLPFMAALFMGDYPGEMPSAPLPPPPPPLPPRRKVSEPRHLHPFSPIPLPPRNVPRKPAIDVGYTELKKSPTFYLKLASAILKFLSSMTKSENGKLQEFLRESIRVEHVSGLAWLVQIVELSLIGSVDNTGDENAHVKSSKAAAASFADEIQSFARDLFGVVHEMVMSGAIDEQLHGVFLRELGLVAICWPLRVSLSLLSLLGRILICRLQRRAMEDVQGDDPLAVNIWKGFLTTLEENACSGEYENEDLDVSHLQLLLFVWHSFTVETKKALLSQCAIAVTRAAQTKENGAYVSPLVVSRLLLVLDYLLFRFSEPSPNLTEQVNHNLFSGDTTSSTKNTVSSPLSPLAAVPGVMCYPCDQQLRYMTVLSKPSCATSPMSSLSSRGLLRAEALTPWFYNVRPQRFQQEGESDELHRELGEIDMEACKTVLALKSDDDITYNSLCRALAILLSCGTGCNRLHGKRFQNKVLAVCASHRCFSLSMSLLTALPPSYNVLTAIVDGTGLSCKSSVGAGLLLHVLHVHLRFKSHFIDTEDVLDTLVESGYSQDESEEVIGRVISVLNSNDHLLSQSITILEELVNSADATSMLPLMSVVALDFIFVLLTKLVAEELQLSTATETPPSKAASFLEGRGKTMISILIKVAMKLVGYAHLYVLIPSDTSQGGDSHAPSISGDSPPQGVLETLLRLSGRCPVVNSNDAKGQLFSQHIPEEIKRMVNLWNSSLIIDPSSRRMLSSPGDEISNGMLISFLNLHYTAFAGSRPFDLARNVKSCILSLFGLLSELFSLQPSECQEAIASLVPLASDQLMEFASEDLRKIAVLCKDFETQCKRYKLSEGFRLVQLPCMQTCSLLGPVIGDFFAFLSSMLDSTGDCSVLTTVLGMDDPPANIITLAMLAASPMASSTAITESLKFLSKVLHLAEKATSSGKPLGDSPHLEVLVRQVSGLALLPPEQLSTWIRRLVVGSPADNEMDAETNTSLLRKLMEVLSKEECEVDPGVSSVLLSTLLPLGSELLDSLTTTKTALPVFKDLFETLILLAGTDKDRGHLILAKAVEGWLPQCINALRAKAKGSDLQSEQELVVPASSLMLYLSHLTSAVQFITNMVRSAEKRNLAGETDSALQESDSEDDEDEETGATAEEDDSEGQESDEEALNSKLCTFTVTSREFMNQHWYHCHTCKLVDGTGVCSICAKVCHKGHDLTYSKFGSFFCDCGAKEDKSCKALVKRSSKTTEEGDSPLPLPERTLFSDSQRSKRRREGKRRRKRRGKEKDRGRGEKEGWRGRGKGKKVMREFIRRSSFPSLPTLKIAHQIDRYKTELRAYLDSSGMADHTLSLLHFLLPSVVSDMDKATSSGCNSARQAMIDLHTNDKEIEYTDNLMAATLGSQEGAFENVRLNFTGDQGQVMRQLISSNALRRIAMCTLASFKGKRQHLCVTHDKGKLTILQLFPILKQADSNRRKLTLTRLSTTSIPFTVLSMNHNPCYEDFLIVCGLKEAQLLVINPSGQVTQRAMLHPSVDGDGYIVKSMWIPGSETEMVIVTDTFVKIYDLQVDLICPMYYFVILTGKIKDATIATTDEGNFLIVITSTGHIFSQPIISACTAVEGPVYFTIDWQAKHPAIQESDGTVCGGGASIYYSHTLEMLFFSYNNGQSFAATLNMEVTDTTKVFEIPLKSNSGTKGSGHALVQWTEVQNHPGLVCALSQTTSNPVVLLVKPDQIQVHELKALPNKAKVQGMVAMRQPPSPGDKSTHHRTTLIILCEDGSLRIYVANTNANTEYWLQPQFQPTSPLAVLKSRARKVVASGRGGGGRGGIAGRQIEAPKFSVDFFEHCQPVQYTDLEFGGNDVLHVYNKQQVKHRLNSGGLYIANTKAAGFTVEVTSHVSSSTAIVGVRVLLGCRSLERAPSYVDVFGRPHPVSFPSNASRWVDVPFTREESLQSDKSFKIAFGPSLDPSGVSMVDSIRVYGKAKDVFGWPEHLPGPAKASSSSSHSASLLAQTEEDGVERTEVMPLTSCKPLSAIDRLVCNAFCILGNHCISIEKAKWPDVSDIISHANLLLMYSVPFSLRYYFKFLMACRTDSKEHYHRQKDLVQLSHVIDMLVTRNDQPGSTLMEPEYYQYLLLMLRAIARSRPENLMLVALPELSSKFAPEKKPTSTEGTDREGGEGDEGKVAEDEELEGKKDEEEEKRVEQAEEEGGSGEGSVKRNEEEDGELVKSSAEKALDRTEKIELFLELLNEVFWMLFARQPSGPDTAPVVNPGFAAVDITVMLMTELNWAFVLQDHTLLNTGFKYTLRFILAADSELCETSLGALTRVLKPRKPKKEKALKAVEGPEATPLIEEVDSEAPVTARAVEEEKDEDEEEGERRMEVEVGEEPVSVEGEAAGEVEEEREEGGQGQRGGEVEAGPDQEWEEQQPNGRPEPVVDQEEAIAHPAETLEQFLAHPEQYMVAMQGLIPDEEAMMNLAIAMSLRDEVGAAEGAEGEAPHAIHAALQVLGLPLPPQLGAGALEQQPPPPGGPEGGGGGEEEDEDEEEKDAYQVVPKMDQREGTEVEEGEEEEEEGEAAEDRMSSSSSLFDSATEEPGEGVLRDSTATPSEVPAASHSRQRGREKRGGGGGGEGKERGGRGGGSPGRQQDVSSEPEMVNDSSGEDEPGEDEGTIVDNLNQQLQEGEPPVPGDQSGKGGGLDDPATRLAVLRKGTMTLLLDNLFLVELSGGMRAICFMQLLLFLSSNLECTKEDCEALVSMLKTLIRQLEFDEEDVSHVVTRSRKREVLLLYLRFFNILMSRKKLKADDSKSSYASHMLWFATARTLLKDSQCMEFCRKILRAIMGKEKCLEVVEEKPPLGGSLFHPVFTHPLTDMSPFFQKQYAKGHSSDLFAGYGRLLAEIVLVLPSQLKKMSEITKHLPTPEFGPEWIETLCDYLLKVAQTTGVGRRHVRKLLLYICGSKEKYRLTRDIHALRSYMMIIRKDCRSGGFDPEQPTGLPVHLSYKDTLALIEQLKACDEVASTHTSNWQAFCLEERSTLPYLFQASFVLDEGLAPLVFQLILTALSGKPAKSTDVTKDSASKDEGGGGRSKRTGGKEKAGTKEDKADKKAAAGTDASSPASPTPDKEMCRTLVQLFLSFVDDESLLQFIHRFLLQSNSTPLRWQAHSLLHCLYQYCQPAEQVHLVELLWRLWPNMPGYGHKASQFVDLLGYFSISTPQVLEKEPLCQVFVEKAIALLKQQNELVSTHPNSHVYSQLLSLVDFDGYYLESEPCLVCNDPEVPYSMVKLYSIKSEVRYSPGMILVKLVGSYTFSQVVLRISDIKRTKMVRTVNLYYSNKTVQNVIELKNKRHQWLKARTCNLTAGQTEVKIDFPLPIVACNLILEFSDFYDNLQGGSEVLQCPRCQASVPAHPGVCGTCGENVYQCHKCRAINYDEKDPFLCNSCGFSKYAKFEITVETKACSAIDPIESEEDRQKTMANVNTLLERADKVYSHLVQLRVELDQLLISLASGHSVVATNSGRAALLSGETGVNRGIQLVAQRYCLDCKTTYQELSKIVQGVLASRRELVKYDQKKMEMGVPPIIPSEPSTPVVVTPTASHAKLLSFPSFPSVTSHKPGATPAIPHSHCFGCASAATEHCITLLKALSFLPQTRKLLVRQNLIKELVDSNLRSGSLQIQRDIRQLLCHLTRDDPAATAELNDFVQVRVLEQIAPHRISPQLASAVRPEMLLLSASLEMEDSCWEQRLRTVLFLFRKSQSHPSPAVMAGVTMPCLKILQSLIYPKDPRSARNKSKELLEVSCVTETGDQISVKASEWLKGDPRVSFERWKQSATEKGTDLKTLSKEELCRYKLMEKYALIWRSRTKKVLQFRSTLRQASWLRSMLFNPNSPSARAATCKMIASLSQGEVRRRQILDLLYSFLDDIGGAGEHAREFLELLQSLTEEPSGKWKSYLAMRGVLPKIGALIAHEINHIQVLEETTLSSDLSQGYALKMLTALLQSFLQVDRIKQLFKNKLVGMVLDGYLSLKRLVVQRTKRIDESQELLLEMLEDLTSGTDEERQEFMAICVQTMKKFKKSDLITPIFVFERLCSIIHPEEEDVGEFYVSLEKDPQQEEFLQGRMQGNPYPSSASGLGPLMRDVKNKICTDCELIALLEDDTGMELLVANKIVSLDLPVKDVFKKIWCAQPNHPECMRVVYRMRGLLGDATEEFVEKLEGGKDQDVDEEEVYKMAAILSSCGGLDAILSRLARVTDFLRGHHLISAALKLLGFCVKLKVNLEYLALPHLNTLNILLRVLNLALQHEETHSNGIGAAVAETALEVMERTLQESSSTQPVLVTTPSGEEIPPVMEGGHPLRMLLHHIESPFVQSHHSVREGLMHIIPFLTFGDPRNMTVLLDYFMPFINFEKYDTERSSENKLYLECLCHIASGIGSDASGEKLKDLAMEMGLAPAAMAYLKQRVPHKAGTFDAREWKLCVSQPSLPYVLKLLTGLCKKHTKTQLALIEVIPELHLLEQVASEEHIGTMAENLLEAMMDEPDSQQKIKEVRRATREEKKRKAMAMRAKELGALGMQVNEKGQVIAKSSLMKEMESEIVEETGVKCCICLEGYKSHPTKVLGVYTYTRKVTLDEFETKPRKTMGYCTVSHFNVVHYDCHSAAVKLARARDEWESAILQNANTKCNGLLPIWGPEVSDSSFASSLARHNSYLQECTGLYDPSFHSIAHDLRLLLLRFAYERSFSAESGGGGPQSNMHLIPYLMHVALYILNTTRTFQREERNLTTFLSAPADKWVHSAYELDGPLYAIVLSLFVQDLQQWEENKLVFLRRLLVLSHARNSSSSSIRSLHSSEPAEYAVYRPMLVLFGLVDGLHHTLKESVDVSGSDMAQAVLDYIRSNDVAVLDGCDKLLVKYQEELFPAESFEEFCDVMDLLGGVESPGAFLSDLLTSVTAT